METKYLDLFLVNNTLLKDMLSSTEANVTINFTALTSALKGEHLNVTRIKDSFSLIHLHTDESSVFRGEHILMLAFIMSLNEDYEKHLMCILNVFDELETHFSDTHFLALCSEIMCSYKIKDLKPFCERIKQTYYQIKKHHWFIADDEDVCMCCLLCCNYENSLFKIEEAESCYKYLKDIKFSSSNTLQHLSQILAFSNKDIIDKCTFVVRLQQFLEKENIVIQNKALPLLGFVALTIDNFDEFIPYFKEIDQQLQDSSKFSFLPLNSELRYIISGSLTIITLLKMQNKLEDYADIIEILIFNILAISTKETSHLLTRLKNKIFTD